MPKLKRFSKKNKLNTKNILISFAIIMGIMLITITSKSYAIYKLQQDYDVIKNKIGSFSMGDVRLAVLVDGKEASEFPSYETNYKVESIDCTNGVTATFDVENWQINIADMSATSTKCTVSFNSKETNEITPVNYTKTELVALNESLTDDFKTSLKKELLNETYPVGSIYISTTDSSVDDVVKRFGGTWIAYSEGRTLIGVGSNGTSSYTVNDKGGNETVSISHNHQFTWSGAHRHALPIFRRNNNNDMFFPWNLGDSHTTPTSFASDGVYISNSVVGSISATTTYSGLLRYNSGAATITVQGDTTSSGEDIDVKQPYTVVYMYKRTA